MEQGIVVQLVHESLVRFYWPATGFDFACLNAERTSGDDEPKTEQYVPKVHILGLPGNGRK
jgi:hypothetical protein